LALFAALLFAFSDAAYRVMASAYVTGTVVKRDNYHVDHGKGRRNF